MFNISKLVNKITDRAAGSGEPARSGSVSGSHVVQNTEEQHSEGFLCPQCMRAFPSKEVLETHYNDTHAQSDYVSISGSEDTSNNVGDDDLDILREQVQTLELCLAEEKLTSEDLKSEIVKLRTNHQLVGDSQGKQFDADRALLNSEVALLRKQLTDSLEQISTSKKDMEKVLLKNEALQTESQSLKSTIGSLETQLTHKNSIDDAAVLKQELVSVQKMMDKLSQEKEKQIEQLNGKIQILEKSDATKELQLKISKADENVNSMTNTIEKQKLEIQKLVNERQVELKQSSQKLEEVNSQLNDVNHRKADLESQCATLTDELKRLNDQHAELYRKFEGGEGASAALAALQLENTQLKENSTFLNQKISEQSATLQQTEKAMESEALNLKSTIEGLNRQLSAATEDSKALNSKNLELTGNVAELNKCVESKKEELEGLTQSFAAERKELEAKLAQSNDAGKSKDESISKLKIDLDNLQTEFLQKDAELSSAQEKYANEIANLQLECKNITDAKDNHEKEIEGLKSEKDSFSNKIVELSKAVEVFSSSEKDLKTALEQKTNDYTELSKTLDEAQKAKEILEEKLRQISATHATYTAQVAELKTQLNRIEEQSRIKIDELESTISIAEQETNQVRESLQKVTEEKKLVTERMEEMESHAETINSKFKQMESEQALLQSQKDVALKDKIELEKRFRTTEDEKTLLLEKCLSSETEFEQLQQKLGGMQRKLDDSYAALQELGRENQSLQMESAKLQGRKWADDSVVTNCTCCGKDFSLTIRKHHCRNCGLIYCDGCSSRTASVPSCKKPARVCDNCYQDLNKKLNN